MKPFPQTMKENRRYLVFEVIGEQKFSKEEVSKALWKTMFSMIGTTGAAASGFWIIDFKEEEQKGMLRCNSEWLEFIRGVLCFLTEVNNKKAFIHIIRTSGTIKKAREKTGL